MKTHLLACVLTTCAHYAFAQADVKAWTRLAGTVSEDLGYAVAADRFGNGIVVGATQGSMSGGNAGRYDLFVVKYDAAGNRLWARQRGSSEREFAYGVATDPSGNIYAAGYTGAGLDGNANIGGWDVFLTKFDASGNWQWTKQDGTGQDDEGRAVCTDASGNIYITGYVRGNFHGITRVGTADVFIMKFNPAPQVPPAAPVAKAATGVTTNAFTANWNSSSGATGYLLDISTDSAFNNYVAGFQNTGVGTLLSVYIGGLSAGTTYYYRVRANNSNGTSSNSATISATTLLKLGYARQGSVLVFSWPTNAAGFALQYAPSLPPANWTAALPAPVVVGEQYVVTNSLADAGRSYRLSKP